MPLVECELSRVVMSETRDHQMLELAEKGGERTITIMIGPFEVWAIHRTIHNVQLRRPLTHELFGNVLDELGVKVERVIVSALREDTYFGRLILTRDGKTYDIDSRPSDALALAAQKKAPIFVEEEVLRKASQPL